MQYHIHNIIHFNHKQRKKETHTQSKEKKPPIKEMKI